MNSGEILEMSSTGTFDFCKFYIFDICEIFKNVKSPHQPTLFISDNKCHKLVSNYFHKNATRNIFCAYQLNKYTKNDSLSQFFFIFCMRLWEEKICQTPRFTPKLNPWKDPWPTLPVTNTMTNIMSNSMTDTMKESRMQTSFAAKEKHCIDPCGWVTLVFGGINLNFDSSCCN